ncbi:NAD(P)-dependent oxidoreductase [Halegenticoccus tardaugens]|uniref:NAD(P)-dependent oxidoreductase n=1 Tax=Halegenticoccus tardaugens TaxID=2071624 RepID=UPI00100BD75B|nr:NAD(P)-dependent oxidoreductase [Halegenticoccus tardaugens]
MTRYIVVDPLFEDVWPLVADHLRRHSEEDGPVELVRLAEPRERPLGSAIEEHSAATQLVSLGVEVTPACLDRFDNLEEAFVMTDSMYAVDEERKRQLEERGVTVHDHTNEGFWSESVAEFGIALTINGLRQLPQKYKAMIESHGPWDLDQLHNEVPGARGHQFADDPTFVNGTVAGKRVRVAGVGNIGSRYASAADFLGADVAAYDPYADEPCFHRTGARRVHDLEELVHDADVFAPTVPLTDATKGLITADHVNALPEGALLVLITRAGVCDMDAVRERVLADEIALAADVWDEEPLSLSDPLLDRHNVVHTPHIAGRTADANHRWAEHLLAHFTPISRP